MMTVFITTKTTAPLTTVMFLLLLGLLFKVLYVIFGVVKSDSRLAAGFKLKIV
jgi:hypothetical protein